jgi:hypothetical protein
VVRCKRQVNLDAVYCFKQTREDFYDCLFPLERLWEDGTQEYNIL